MTNPQLEKDAQALADFHQFFADKKETVAVMFGVKALELLNTAQEAAQRYATPKPPKDDNELDD